jgi:hypothetical protein
MGNRFASSFSKRKYTKGYYVDIPSRIGTVATQLNKPIKEVHQSPHIVTAPLQPVVATASAKEEPTVITRSQHKPLPKIAAPTSFIPQHKMPVIQADTTAPDETAKVSSADINFVAIAGFVLSIVGTVLTVVNTFITIGAIVALALALVLCIYSLFLRKIYWTWLAVIGLCLLTIILTLLLL